MGRNIYLHDVLYLFTLPSTYYTENTKRSKHVGHSNEGKHANLLGTWRSDLILYVSMSEANLFREPKQEQTNSSDSPSRLKQ